MGNVCNRHHRAGRRTQLNPGAQRVSILRHAGREVQSVAVDTGCDQMIGNPLSALLGVSEQTLSRGIGIGGVANTGNVNR